MYETVQSASIKYVDDDCYSKEITREKLKLITYTRNGLCYILAFYYYS